MARPLRIEYAGTFYHVLNRGQRREPALQDGQDGERFVSDLSKLAQQYDVLIHGYCMMTKDHQLAKDLDRLRPRCRIMNNEDVTRTLTRTPMDSQSQCSILSNRPDAH
jgi:hypothetical protein